MGGSFSQAPKRWLLPAEGGKIFYGVQIIGDFSRLKAGSFKLSRILAKGVSAWYQARRSWRLGFLALGTPGGGVFPKHRNPSTIPDHPLAGGWEKCGGRPGPCRIVSRWAKEPFIIFFCADFFKFFFLIFFGIFFGDFFLEKNIFFWNIFFGIFFFADSE